MVDASEIPILSGFLCLGDYFMPDEFNLDSTVNVPGRIVEKYVDGYYLEIAPDYPNWIVINPLEQRMFEFLRKGDSIRSALESFYSSNDKSEDECLEIMTNLLAKINDMSFFDSTESMPEESITDIKKTIHIGTTNGCNMRCKHCYMSAGMHQLETVDLDKTISLVSQFNKLYGELEIVVSGGEPLTYKGIYDLLRAIKDNHIILFTNGSLINEENIDCIAECCNEVQISFEGISEEYYSKVRGKDYYKRVINAIELLKSRNIRIVLAITVLPDTLYDVRDNLLPFYDRLEYANVEIRLNDEIDVSGNALNLDLSKYDEKESKDIIVSLMKELRKRNVSIHKDNNRNVRITNCGIGGSVVINYDGKIYPCSKYSDFFFDINTSASIIKDEFDKYNIQTSNENIPKCSGCDLRYICSGGCRIDHYKKTGSMTKVVCDESTKMKQYKQMVLDYRLYEDL